MDTLVAPLVHEKVTVARGPRSGCTVIVAVHDTTLGPALGGCRVRGYADWAAGLADALRLSEAMTYKAALAGLAHGGGKAVVAMPAGAAAPTGPARESLMLDIADAVQALDGAYATGPDVGTSPADMDVIHRGTRYVACRTEEVGGSGDSGPATADGTYAALLAVAEHLYGTSDVQGLRIGVLGLGSVGTRLTRRLARAGAVLSVADTDPARRAVAQETGAAWVGVDELPARELDVLVPAAVGGLLTHDLARRLRCSAVAGPANNQLADEDVARVLHGRGVLWAPDYIVSAGGIIHGVAREEDGDSPEAAARRVDGIGDTLLAVLTEAARAGITPHEQAMARARSLIAAAGTRAHLTTA